MCIEASCFLQFRQSLYPNINYEKSTFRLSSFLSVEEATQVNTNSFLFWRMETSGWSTADCIKQKRMVSSLKLCNQHSQKQNRQKSHSDERHKQEVAITHFLGASCVAATELKVHERVKMTMIFNIRLGSIRKNVRLAFRRLWNSCIALCCGGRQHYKIA